MLLGLLALGACTPEGPAVSLGRPPLDDTAAATPPERLPDADTVPAWEPCEEPATVRLSELVAANHHGQLDAEGDTSDWLELAPVAGAASLDGWALSEDAVTLWELPEGDLTGPTVVFASGKTDGVGEELHAPFRLDANGGDLFLHGPGGCVAEHVERPRLFADVAFGRTESGEWAYFLAPTPGAPNTTESRPGFAAPPTFDPPGGRVDAGARVTLAGAGALTYTLDGSVPDAGDTRYDAPFSLPEGHVVPVRAVATVEGLWPSRPATTSYIPKADRFDAGVRVIALTFEPDDFFDPRTGIYTPGPDYEPAYPYFGANFWEPWERDVHVEVFGPDGARIVDQDAGVQIAGGYSRAFDQRNLELIARSGYGPDTFAAALFDDEPYADYSKLYLRNGGDWCSTQILDATVQSLFRTADGGRAPSVDAQAYEPALVYLNGEFWGVYELKERLDEDWAARHRGVDPDALDFVKLGWTHDANWTLESGDWDAFNALEALVATRDLADPDAYAAFTERVDVDNFIGAVVAQGWIGNGDWWGNNLRMWRPRAPAGPFRWTVYDFGHGWPSPTYDHLATSVNGTWTGLPIGAALRNPTFHAGFVNVHADWLNTTLRGPAAAANVAALAAEARPVMPEQRARWCGGADMESWESAIATAESFAERRAGAVETGLLRHLAPGDRRTLTLTANPPTSGAFDLAVVRVESGFSGTYYADVPVTVTAVAGGGATFDGWSDGVADATRTVTLAADTTLTARFR